MQSRGKIAVVTLGCKLNFAESSSLAQQFISEGFTEVSPCSFADLYIVNTCTVTEHSDKKCRNLIRRVHTINPNAIIIVTGCYAQIKGEQIAKIEGVTSVVPQSAKGSIVNVALNLMKLKNAATAVNEFKEKSEIFPACSFGERTRSFLKIQDGCDYFCTYCAIPYARGRSSCVPSEIVLRMASELSAKGIKEIVLTGVNIGDYTRVSNDIGFLDLLKLLNDIEGIERFRISSIEPNLLTDEIIDWISSERKFVPHFHIPLQSGSNATLSRMHRKYTTEFFASKIEYIRAKMGDVFFGIDVIVGFPGETEQEFEQTYSFLSEVVKPAFLHIFPYSKREGTPAAKMEGQVSENIKQLRVRRLEELSDKLHNEYISRFKGTEQDVLFESSVKLRGTQRVMEGYTSNYIRVTAPYNPNLIGKIVRMKI